MAWDLCGAATGAGQCSAEAGGEHEGEEARKVQLGCVDTLGCLVRSCLPTATGPDSAESANLEPSPAEEVPGADDQETIAGQPLVVPGASPQRPLIAELASTSLRDDESCEELPEVLRVLTDGSFCGSIARAWAQLLPSERKVPIALRVLMANVLISAARGLEGRAARAAFAERVFPALLLHAQVAHADAALRAAVLQALFMGVYGTKEAVVPYAAPLLRTALGALRRSDGDEDERMAAMRLMTALLAGEEKVLQACEDMLSEVEVTLRSVAMMDCSAALRGMAEQVLRCLTVPA
ncbi:hypothetical protein CYMTET_22390 [Cymbomonas tetramitiformis]|uniref:Uncharacterized protein n=1 Tax=Cymbomonas tetramitiformis TaxID=36881 RepID=A0AAE0L267_9CHLO|nr:hypothetical protein CYMTET_22390 [Cymbomonas tetramitiformis]